MIFKPEDWVILYFAVSDYAEELFKSEMDPFIPPEKAMDLFDRLSKHMHENRLFKF